VPDVNDYGQICQDSTTELFKETLLIMRVKLGSDRDMFVVLKTLFTILQNIIKNPNDPKYQKLRLQNAQIKAAITDVE